MGQGQLLWLEVVPYYIVYTLPALGLFLWAKF